MAAVWRRPSQWAVPVFLCTPVVACIQQMQTNGLALWRRILSPPGLMRASLIIFSCAPLKAITTLSGCTAPRFDFVSIRPPKPVFKAPSWPLASDSYSVYRIQLDLWDRICFLCDIVTWHLFVLIYSFIQYALWWLILLVYSLYTDPHSFTLLGQDFCAPQAIFSFWAFSAVSRFIWENGPFTGGVCRGLPALGGVRSLGAQIQQTRQVCVPNQGFPDMCSKCSGDPLGF